MQLTDSEMTEARNVARKIAHHPPEDIALHLNERMHLKKKRALSADDVRQLLQQEGVNR